MRNFLKSVLERRKIIIFLAIIVMLFGIINYSVMPKKQSPEVDISVAIITTIYPGASAEDVERIVTSKIEDKLLEMRNCLEVDSYSTNSLSVVVYSIEYSNNLSADWDELKKEMNNLQRQLPEEVGEIEVVNDFASSAGFIYAISPIEETVDISQYASNLKENLVNIDGVSYIELAGHKEEEIVIEIEEEKRASIGISYSEILDIVKAENIEIPAGRTYKNGEVINVRTAGFFQSIDDIKNIIIGINEDTGEFVNLQDIANIYINEEYVDYKGNVNNKEAVFVAGFFEDDVNILPIGDVVLEEVELFKSEFDDKVVVEEVLFEQEYVSEEIGSFVKSLMQGILFVVVIVFIGMGLRNAIIISTAIPLSVLMSVSLAKLFGINVHQVSIASMIMVLGMLVDNAIVVSDSIQLKLNNNEARLNACINGVREVASPVFTSTITTICTFAPILFMGGEVGEYLKSLPIIVISALLSSYIVAIMVIPSVAYIFFKPAKKVKLKTKIVTLVGSLVEFFINKKYIIVLICFVGIVFTIFTAKGINLKFFPYAELDMMYVDMYANALDDKDKTEEATKEVVNTIMSYEEVDLVASAIGGVLPRFFYTMGISTPSDNYSQILIKYNKDKVGKNNRFQTATELRDSIQLDLNENIESSRTRVVQLELAYPVGSPVAVKIMGDDLDELKNLGEDILEELEKIEGVINAKIDYENEQEEFLIKPKEELLAMYGLNNYIIQNEVNIALSGREAGIAKFDYDDYNIIVKGNIGDITDIENIMIKSSLSQQGYQLKEIVYLDNNLIMPVIKKSDGELAVIITSDVIDGYSALQITDTLAERIDEMNTDNLTISYEGEKKAIFENFGNLLSLAIVFIAIILGILLVQFKKFTQPLYILITIPLAVCGSIWGLYFSKTDLSFTALLGMVSLAGIVVNNAIVLIDCINKLEREGYSRKKSCIIGAQKRVRPIILSSITTIIGLIPLVWMRSTLFTPMAITLISGLLVSSVLTVVVIPVLLSIGSKK